MDDKTKATLAQMPKQYAESIFFGHERDMFVMAVLCGTNVSSFAINPRHMKRMLKALSENLAKYEESNGPITGEWNVPSPIQMSDLSNPNEKGPDVGPKSK